jgi:hypothetical protein
MKMVFLGLCVALLATALFAAPSGLSIGWASFPPYQTSASSGLDVELAQAIFTQAGYTPASKELPWARQLNDS